MACTITDKEREVLTNAGFKLDKFGAWVGEHDNGVKYAHELIPSDSGVWYARAASDYGHGYVARSSSVSALLAYCQMNDWYQVSTNYAQVPLVGG